MQIGFSLILVIAAILIITALIILIKKTGNPWRTFRVWGVTLLGAVIIIALLLVSCQAINGFQYPVIQSSQESFEWQGNTYHLKSPEQLWTPVGNLDERVFRVEPPSNSFFSSIFGNIFPQYISTLQEDDEHIFLAEWSGMDQNRLFIKEGTQVPDPYTADISEARVLGKKIAISIDENIMELIRSEMLAASQAKEISYNDEDLQVEYGLELQFKDFPAWYEALVVGRTPDGKLVSYLPNYDTSIEIYVVELNPELESFLSTAN